MFKSDALSVGTTAVELTANFDTDQEYELHIDADDPDFYIGDSSVTSGVGFPVVSPLRLQSGTKVYGVFASGTHVVRMLARSV